MSDEINRNQLLDRHTFIDEKTAIKAAFSKGTWFVIGREDGASAIEEPMPESIKATGKIPEGYALGEFKLLVYISLSFYKMIAELDLILREREVQAQTKNVVYAKGLTSEKSVNIHPPPSVPNIGLGVPVTITVLGYIGKDL